MEEHSRMSSMLSSFTESQRPPVDESRRQLASENRPSEGSSQLSNPQDRNEESSFLRRFRLLFRSRQQQSPDDQILPPAREQVPTVKEGASTSRGETAELIQRSRSRSNPADEIYSDPASGFSESVSQKSQSKRDLSSTSQLDGKFLRHVRNFWKPIVGVLLIVLELQAFLYPALGTKVSDQVTRIALIGAGGVVATVTFSVTIMPWACRAHNKCREKKDKERTRQKEAKKKADDKKKMDALKSQFLEGSQHDSLLEVGSTSECRSESTSKDVKETLPTDETLHTIETLPEASVARAPICGRETPTDDESLPSR